MPCVQSDGGWRRDRVRAPGSRAGCARQLADRVRPHGRAAQAWRVGVGAGCRAQWTGRRLRRPLAPAGDRLPQRRPDRRQLGLFRQAGARDTDGCLHDPPEGRTAPVEQVQQRADAVPATPHLGRCRAPCRRAPRLSGEPRLRAPALWLFARIVRHHLPRCNGRDRRRRRRATSAAPRPACSHPSMQRAVGSSAHCSISSSSAGNPNDPRVVR